MKKRVKNIKIIHLNNSGNKPKGRFMNKEEKGKFYGIEIKNFTVFPPQKDNIRTSKK